MKPWFKDFLYNLIGMYPSNGIIECKSYNVVQYLKAIGYKGEFYTKLKEKANDSKS